MAKTFKILSAISFIAMAIVLTFVGVWALTDLDFSVGGDITYTAPKPYELIQDEKGYYVEMGTYQGNPVKWRLVGVKEEGTSENTKFTGSTAPTSGTGTFILETYTMIPHVYDETNLSNEYATSDIRTYLNGEYITKLGLANDATYNAISAIEISDLYTDMAWRIDDANKVEDCTLPSGATGADKLWLMSVAEVYTLLGGGTIGADGTIPSSWSTEVKADCNWDANNTSDYYWSRSPYPYGFFGAFCVSDNGDWDDDDVDNSFAVRPAFNLNF